MPAKSRKQQRYLYRKFGAAWVRRHHFNRLSRKKKGEKVKKHQLGNSKPKSNARTKSRISKASSNSGGGFNSAAGKGGPGQAHEKSMTGGGGY